MLWLTFAIIAAVSAASTNIVMKIGLKKVDCDVATFLRTVVVLVLIFIIALAFGTFGYVVVISGREWVFIIGSGVATAVSWLGFYKALKLADASKVLPIDRLSAALTIILAIFIFNEELVLLTLFSIIIMIIGVLFMTLSTAKNSGFVKLGDNKKPSKVGASKKNLWWVYAIVALVAASFNAIFARIGMQSIPVQLGTFLRTIVVIVFLLIITYGRGKLPKIKLLKPRSILPLVISAALTAVSWLAFYTAIQIGYLSRVLPIDKLSIVIAIAFASIFLKEKMSKKAIAGLGLIIVATVMLIF